VPGAVGIDLHPKSTADIRADLDHFPWPVPDSSFDLVRMEHCIEHLANPIRAIEECHRIATPGGEVFIQTPYASNFQSYRDPTHRLHPTWETFDYFDEESPLARLAAYTTVRFRTIGKRLIFGKSAYDLIGRAIFAMSSRWYEKYFMWGFPARELVIRLKVIKDIPSGNIPPNSAE
jgi:SAM-dependent methyltransferase